MIIIFPEVVSLLQTNVTEIETVDNCLVTREEVLTPSQCQNPMLSLSTVLPPISVG